jgi:hypothetical protein
VATVFIADSIITRSWWEPTHLSQTHLDPPLSQPSLSLFFFFVPIRSIKELFRCAIEWVSLFRLVPVQSTILSWPTKSIIIIIIITNTNRLVKKKQNKTKSRRHPFVCRRFFVVVFFSTRPCQHRKLLDHLSCFVFVFFFNPYFTILFHHFDMREKKNFNHMRAKERNTTMLQQYDWKFKTKQKKKK